MATFITTAAISHNIEEIIKNAQKYFVIVSPYLSIHKLLRKKIEAKLSEADEHFKIIFVCKENDLKNKNTGELIWIQSLPKIKFFNCSELHAKCYLNEKTAIITSMNLYEYSQVNNI